MGDDRSNDMRSFFIAATMIAFSFFSVASHAAESGNPQRTGGVHPVDAAKQATRQIGHGVRKGTRAIGHGVRDSARVVGHAARKVARKAVSK
jgi:hypothetical protein